MTTSPSQPAQRRHGMALGLAMVAAVAALCLWLCAVYERALATDARARIALLAGSHARTLSEAIASRLAHLRGLQAFVIAELEHDPAAPARLGERFPVYAAPLVQADSGIRNLSVAPGAVQRWVYPLAGNERVVGHDLLADPRPDVAESVRRALEYPGIALSGPYQLRQGGLGLVARVAIRHDGRVWGLAAMVLDLPPLLASAGLGGGGDLAFALRGPDGQVFAGDAEVLARDPVMAALQLPGADWQLAAVPRVGWDAALSAEIWRVRLTAAAVALAFLLGVAYVLRQETRATLLASERRFRDLAEIAADWFWEMDGDLRLTYCSPGFPTIAGVDPAAMLGRSYRDLADRHIRCVDDLGPALAARQSFRDIRVVWRGDDGRTLHLDISGMPIHEDGRFRGYRGTGRDATAEVAARAEAQAATDARHAAEAESRAKSAFLARMSHELRTPLNAILGFSDAMVSEVFGAIQPARYRDYAADIHNSGSHLLAIISELLDLSLIEAGRLEIKPQLISLNELVGEVATVAAPLAARRRNRFACTIEGDALLSVDATRVRQVLLNLLANASKFTTDGEVRLSAAIEGDRLVLRVADTGIGMAPADLSRLFGDFSQLEAGRARCGEGVGLGLSISRRLCRLMGGEVTADSAPGRGSVFTVTLPATCPVCGPVPIPQTAP